jgi:hypothetical protein
MPLIEALEDGRLRRLMIHRDTVLPPPGQLPIVRFDKGNFHSR